MLPFKAVKNCHPQNKWNKTNCLTQPFQHNFLSDEHLHSFTQGLLSFIAVSFILIVIELKVKKKNFLPAHL